VSIYSSVGRKTDGRAMSEPKLEDAIKLKAAKKIAKELNESA
jgi:hypothetical protein